MKKMFNDMEEVFKWMDRELYPALYSSIGSLLPEFEFKESRGNWKSTNKLKNTGEEGSSVGKVYVWNKTPGLINDFTRGSIPIAKYLMNKKGLTFWEVLEELSKEANLTAPTMANFDPEAYEKHQKKLSFLELCSSFYVSELQTSPDREATEIRTTLEDRGYSLEDIKEMELGYISSISKLVEHLQNNGYPKDQANDLIKENLALEEDRRIGTTHRLTIPFRSGGALKGFKYRITTGKGAKYINSLGLDVNGGFFNLLSIEGDKELVIVEGELDALHATIRGLENVVAIGGKSIRDTQIKDAIKRGAKKFTLCLDNDPKEGDPKKIEEEERKINNAIDIILELGVDRIAIAHLEPLVEGGAIDPDTLIKEKGIEALREAINKATLYFEYKLASITNKYDRIIIKEDRELTAKELLDLREEVVEGSSMIENKLDRVAYESIFLRSGASKALGLTKEVLEETTDELRKRREESSLNKELEKIALKVTEETKKGNLKEALELIDTVKDIKLQSRATDFQSLPIGTNREEVRERLVNRPNSLETGYTIGRDEQRDPIPLLIPSGALSVITAPTSHGKTTFIMNLALNILEKYKDKDVYVFNLEEESDAILINSLNTYIGKATGKGIAYNCRNAIREYLTRGTTSTITKEENIGELERQTNKFFKELIEPSRLNIQYFDQDSDTLIEAIRYLHKNTNVGAIFIDYIQLLNTPRGKYKTYSRQEEVKQMCMDLKDISIETGLPIILGAQFNRTVVNHHGIQSTNIGEAGDIERVANLIIGFWNNNLDIAKGSLKDKEVEALEEKGFIEYNTLYTKILKNRGGIVGGEEALAWNGNTATIRNKGVLIKKATNIETMEGNPLGATPEPELPFN